MDLRMGMTVEDADLIVAARNELPHLLSELTRLRAIEVASIAAEQRVKELHKPDTVYVLPWKCVNGDCEHDDTECPEEPHQVCRECWNLWTRDGRDDECFYEDQVGWPCATAHAAALNALPTDPQDCPGCIVDAEYPVGISGTHTCRPIPPGANTMNRPPTMVEHYQSLLAQKEEALRSTEEALRTVLKGDLTLVMDGPTPGIGFDYSYVPATPAVLLTLARLNRSTLPPTPSDSQGATNE